MPAKPNQFPSSSPVFGYGTNLVATDFFERSYTSDSASWAVGPLYLPATPTAAVIPNIPALSNGELLKIDTITLINNGAAAVTVSIVDQGTSVNGGPAALVPNNVSIAKGTEVVFQLAGMPATGGITWSASAANSIQVWMKGSY